MKTLLIRERENVNLKRICSLVLVFLSVFVIYSIIDRKILDLNIISFKLYISVWIIFGLLILFEVTLETLGRYGESTILENRLIILLLSNKLFVSIILSFDIIFLLMLKVDILILIFCITISLFHSNIVDYITSLFKQKLK